MTSINGNGLPPGWTGGLRGVWASIANLTAVGLVCLLFYQQSQADRAQAREDRALFREELQRLHEDSRRHSEAIRSLAQSVKMLADEIGDIAESESALGDFGPGRWVWRLAEAVPFSIPIPARGRLGIFELPFTIEPYLRSA